MGNNLEMYNNWLATEHYRIHAIELWPDGPRKEAGLAAAQSALESLTRTMPTSSFACAICASRQTLILIPSAPRVHSLPPGWAA
jgi:hypothetical protein